MLTVGCVFDVPVCLQPTDNMSNRKERRALKSMDIRSGRGSVQANRCSECVIESQRSALCLGCANRYG